MGRLDASMRRFMAGTLAGYQKCHYPRWRNCSTKSPSFRRIIPKETFAQALRAIGEPIFGRSARDVSIARLLGQLFETTRRFDMQAQPQLVLLRKGMVVVGGVWRRWIRISIEKKPRGRWREMGLGEYGSGSGWQPRRLKPLARGQAGAGPAATGA